MPGPAFQTLRFRGWISCRRDGEGPLALILVGRTEDRPDEVVQLAFAGVAPVDIPEALEDVTVEQVADRRYRISSGDQSWTLDAVAHLHRDVAAVFYRVLPPRPVPWQKRLFWRVVLSLAAHPAGRWLLQRAR